MSDLDTCDACGSRHWHCRCAVKTLEFRLTAVTEDRDRLREALEKISKDTIRIEYRGEDLARYEPSEAAKIAKAALSGEKPGPQDGPHCGGQI